MKVVQNYINNCVWDSTSWWEIESQSGPHKYNIFKTKTDTGKAYKVNCLEWDSR